VRGARTGTDAGVRELVTQGNKPKAVDELLDARRALHAAAPTLPTYDLARYEEELASLQRALTAPRERRFRFKRSASAKEADSAPAPGEAAGSAPTQNDAIRTASTQAPPYAYCPTHGDSREHTPALTAAPTQSPSAGAISLARLKQQVIDYREQPPGSVHATALTDCIVYVGSVHTSVLLEHCTRCIVIGQTAQCRVFASHSLILCLATRSPITLEASRDVVVGTWCDAIPSAPASPVPHVQDFDDIFRTASHWRVMPRHLAEALREALALPATAVTRCFQQGIYDATDL